VTKVSFEKALFLTAAKLESKDQKAKKKERKKEFQTNTLLLTVPRRQGNLSLFEDFCLSVFGRY
jgi:hypothetical protein